MVLLVDDAHRVRRRRDGVARISAAASAGPDAARRQVFSSSTMHAA
jgi:hypothetical protein